VQHAPITLKPVAHSVGQLLTVPSAIQGHELLHSSIYNQADVFLFHDFSKKERRSNDFCGVALPANNLYQRAWARRQIDVAESRLHPAIYLEPGIPENSSESCKSFPDLKLGYCPQCVTATLAAERQPGSDPSMSLIAARSIRHL
jgi:hypothetical protein